MLMLFDWLLGGPVDELTNDVTELDVNKDDRSTLAAVVIPLLLLLEALMVLLLPLKAVPAAMRSGWTPLEHRVLGG